MRRPKARGADVSTMPETGTAPVSTSLKAARKCRGSGQVAVQELDEIAGHIVAAGPAIGEAVLAVQRQRRFEGSATAGLQAEALQSARPRVGDDVRQQRRRHATAQG